MRRIIVWCLSFVLNIALYHNNIKKRSHFATNIEFGKLRMWSEEDHICIISFVLNIALFHNKNKGSQFIGPNINFGKCIMWSEEDHMCMFKFLFYFGHSSGIKGSHLATHIEFWKWIMWSEEDHICVFKFLFCLALARYKKMISPRNKHWVLEVNNVKWGGSYLYVKVLFVWHFSGIKKDLTSQQTSSFGSGECEVRRIIFVCFKFVLDI